MRSYPRVWFKALLRQVKPELIVYEVCSLEGIKVQCLYRIVLLALISTVSFSRLVYLRRLLHV